ncbi:MAG: hypothetical protein SVX43_01855 [Cyanobacteriota bacterium]|nr:hypothetical protein [Cyanobacteriota bacterium]
MEGIIEQLDSPLGEERVLEDIKSWEAIAMLKIGDFSKRARVSVTEIQFPVEKV